MSSAEKNVQIIVVANDPNDADSLIEALNGLRTHVRDFWTKTGFAIESKLTSPLVVIGVIDRMVNADIRIAYTVDVRQDGDSVDVYENRQSPAFALTRK